MDRNQYNEDIQKLRKDREEFVDEWRLTAKAAERIAGLLMIFAAAMLIVLEQPADALAALVAAALVAGGFTLIFRSRRLLQRYQHLYFAKQDRQIRRAAQFGLGTLGLGVMGWQSGRPLFFVLAGLCLLGAIWFRFRAGQVKRYDDSFPHLAQNQSDDNQTQSPEKIIED